MPKGIIGPQVTATCQAGREAAEDLAKLQPTLLENVQQFITAVGKGPITNPDILRPLQTDYPAAWQAVENGDQNNFLTGAMEFAKNVESHYTQAIAALKAEEANPDQKYTPDQLALITQLREAYEAHQTAAQQVCGQLRKQNELLAGMIGQGNKDIYWAVAELAAFENKADGTTVTLEKGDTADALKGRHIYTGKAWWKRYVIPQRNPQTGQVTIHINLGGGFSDRLNAKDRGALALALAHQALLNFGLEPVVITGLSSPQHTEHRNQLIAALVKVGYTLDQISIEVPNQQTGKIKKVRVSEWPEAQKAQFVGLREDYTKDMEDKYKTQYAQERQEGAVAEGIKDASSSAQPAPAPVQQQAQPAPASPAAPAAVQQQQQPAGHNPTLGQRVSNWGSKASHFAQQHLRPSWTRSRTADTNQQGSELQNMSEQPESAVDFHAQL